MPPCAFIYPETGSSLLLPPPKKLHGAITNKFQTGIFYCNFQKCDKKVSNFLLTILLNNFGEGALLYVTIVTIFNFVVRLSNGISIHNSVNGK
jgi:hypothetical protein